MRDIVCTSRDGERFWKIPECYVRGNSIKYLRLPDEALNVAGKQMAHESDRSVLISRGTFRLEFSPFLKLWRQVIDMVKDEPQSRKDLLCSLLPL